MATAEQPRGLERILQLLPRPESKEDRFLRRNNWYKFDLTGKSIKSLQEKYPNLLYSHSRSTIDHYYEHVPTVPRKIAINTKNPFLLNSNYKTLKEQIEMVQNLSEEFKTYGLEVGVGIATENELVEAAAIYLKETDKRLFDAGDKCLYGRTNVLHYWFINFKQERKDYYVTIGNQGSEGLIVSGRDKDSREEDLYIVPVLIFP